MNFAAVFNTPTVFVCENNQYAISVPREKQTKARTIAQKALAYGMPGIQVDGNDVLAVYVATREAAERARKGDGPTLIENVTYRMAVHTTADDPRKYRTKKEESEWQKRDPVERFRKYLTGKNLLSSKKVKEIDNDIQEEIKAAWNEAESTMEKLDKKPEELFEHLYDEMPPYLAQQKEEMTGSGEEADG